MGLVLLFCPAWTRSVRRLSGPSQGTSPVRTLARCHFRRMYAARALPYAHSTPAILRSDRWHSGCARLRRFRTMSRSGRERSVPSATLKSGSHPASPATTASSRKLQRFGSGRFGRSRAGKRLRACRASSAAVQASKQEGSLNGGTDHDGCCVIRSAIRADFGLSFELFWRTLSRSNSGTSSKARRRPCSLRASYDSRSTW